MIDNSFIRKGKEMLKRIAFSICLCAVSQQGMAQEYIPEGTNEEPQFKAENFGFNAIDLYQPRFLHGDSVQYRNEKFSDKVSVGFALRFDKIHERTSKGYIPATNYGLYIDKEFNKLHAMRLLLYRGKYQQAYKSIPMSKYQAELLYSFNWTRYFGGYNPYRRFEALTRVGLGAFYSSRKVSKEDSESEWGPMFIVGAGARVQLNPMVSLGIEPYVALASDNIDHSGTENFHRYDVLYGTDVTLAYNFHHESFKEEVRQRFAGKTFVDFALGAQFEPYSGYYRQPSEIPFLGTAGPQLRLGIGRWLSPGFAVRASGNISASNWDTRHVEVKDKKGHPGYDVRSKNVLTNARLDLLFSPYYFFTQRRNERFDVNAVLGWELGQMIKTAYEPANQVKTDYDGLSAGLQFHFNYDENVALYLEPRITLANYDIPYAGDFEYYVDHYRDYLFSLTAGLEYAVNEYRFLGRKKQPSKFNPHIAYSVLGGPNYLFTINDYAGDFYMDYNAGIAAEMQITPYSGVRVMADYSQLSYRDLYGYSQRKFNNNTLVGGQALYTGKYGFVNLSADYVFDLGTLLQGYNKANRWDIALAAGPVYSLRVSEGGDFSKDEIFANYSGEKPIATSPVVKLEDRIANSSLGVQVGIPVSYRLTPRLELLFEPRVRLFPENYIDQGIGQGYDNSEGPTRMLSAQLGLRYSINDHFYVPTDSLDEDFTPKPGHLFAHMGVGAQTPQAWGDMGPRIEAGVGYWFNPGIATRASLNLASHDWRADQMMAQSFDLRQMSASGRLDLMLAPYEYLANRYDRPFAFNFILGWEYGMMLRGNMSETLLDRYHAFSSGIQFRYNYDGYRALYLEPRYTYNFASANSQYSLVAGLELGRTEYAFRSGKSQPDVFSPSFSFSVLGGIGYVYNGKEYATANPISDYTGGVAAEYKFSPYSSVRMTGTYSNYRMRDLYNAPYSEGNTIENSLRNYNVDYMNLGIDYMFDITTLLQGYTNYRRWNAALAIGPTYGYKVATSEKTLRDGYTPFWESESYSEDAKESYWGAQVGVPVSYNFDNNWAIMFEPRLKASLNHLFNKKSSYPFMQYDALLGVKYTPDEELYKRLEELNQTEGVRHDFINYAMGLQYAAGSGIPFGSTGGVQFGVGYGRWMNSLLGVRFGAEMAASHLHSVSLNGADLLLKSARLGGRVDMMLNPLAFSSSYTPSRFGTALLLGFEVGGKVDAKYTNLDIHAYNSFSLGAQLRYRTNENHTLYIEPRYAVDDRLVSVTAGLEYAITDDRFRSSKNQPGVFKPYYRVGVAGGVTHRFLTNMFAGMPQLGASAGISGEYHFTPYSGVRFTADYAEVTNGSRYDNGKGMRIGHANTGFDYMFDLSTLFAGYTPERRLDVSLAAGPLFSTRTSAGNEYVDQLSESSVGAQVAIPVHYRLTDNLGVSLEPRAQAFLDRNYAGLNAGRNLIANVQMGLKYTIDEDYYNRDKSPEEADSRRDFINYAIGLQYAAGAGMPFGSTGGLQFGVGYGRWMNSLMGVRFGAEMATSHLNTVSLANTDLLLRSARLGGRVDMMVNPLAFSSSYTPGRISAALLLGWEVGGKVDAKYTHLDVHAYNSLSLGAQLRLLTDEDHVFYVEPRYMVDDRLVSVTAGLEYAITEDRFRSSKNQPGMFKPYYRVGVAGGVSHRFMSNISAGMPQLGASAGLSGEYHFTPYSGVRFTADYAEVTNGSRYDNGKDMRIGHANTGFDYMFDLSTLFAGYTPDRRLDVSLAAGPLFSTRTSAGNEYVDQLSESSVGAQVAIPVHYRLTDNFGLSLEPRAQAFLDRNYAGINGGRNLIANVQMGINYTIDEDYYDRVKASDADDRRDFINYAIGLQYAANAGMPFGSTGGLQFGVGYGRWMNSLMGVRFGAEMGTSHLNTVSLANTDLLLRSARLGGRVDMMVNPLALSSSYTPGRISAALLLGWEVGGKVDAKYTHLDVHAYNSLSLGAQLRLLTDEDHVFYIEPRYMVDDRLVSVTAGLEHAITDDRFRSSKRQPGTFKPYYNIGIAGGVSHRFMSNISAGMPQLGASAGISGEYHFTPYSGVRFTADYAEVTNGGSYAGKAMRVGHANTGIDYMFDLSTLFAGYTPDRRLDVSLAAGPVLSARTSTGNDYVDQLAESSVGAQVGFPVQYRLTDNFGLSLEPRAQAFLNSNYAGINGGRNLIANVQMGVKYTPDERYYDRVKASREDNRRDFINYAMGLQYAAGAGMPFGSTGGLQFGVGYGRWMNSLMGVRFGAEMGTSHLNTVSVANTDLLLRSARLGGRVDMMVNPLGFSSSYTPGRISAALLLGFEVGGKVDAKYTHLDLHAYNSLSLGAQLRLLTDEDHVFYIEPRYTVDDRLVSVTAGLEHAITEDRFRSSKRQPGTFKPYYNIGIAGGVNHRLMSSISAGMPQLGVSAGISGEYHFTPYSGVRFTADYAEVTNGGSYAGKAMRVGHTNTGIDYMFDLSTLFAGYTPDRRLDVSLAAGPVLSARTSTGNDYVDQLAESSVGAQVGFPVQYRLTDNFGLSLEPRAQAFLNSNYAGINGGRSLIANVQMGVKYTLDEKYYGRVKVSDKTSHKTSDKASDKTSQKGSDKVSDKAVSKSERVDVRYDFINYAMGIQYTSGTGMPFSSTGGVQFGVGYGRWMNSLMGVRFGAEMATSHLNTVSLDGTNLLLRSARLGGRADMMVNPLAFSSSYTPGRFGAALLLGFEVGGKVDAKYTHLDAHAYSSLSLGAQLRLLTDDNHVLYVEPRYTIDDKLVSVTAGLEYAISENRFRSGKRQPGVFKPYYNMGVAGGVSHRFMTNIAEGMPQLGVTAGISGEYHFTPYSGVRFTADYAEVTNGSRYATGEAMRIGHVNTGIDYMFDLSTLFAGYTPSRRLDISLAAGPVLSARTSSGNDYVDQLTESTVGAQVGFPVHYRLTDNFGLSLEPRAQAFLNRNYAGINGGRNLIANLQVGMKYTPGEQLYRRMEKLNKTYGSRHDFINYAMGLQYAAGAGMPFGSTGGVQFGIGYGRWMNSLMGVRFSGEMATCHLNSVQLAGSDLLLKSARAGVRVDMMVNPLAFSGSYTPGRMGAALLLGWEVGGKVDAKYTHLDIHAYSSLSVGAQLRYQTSEKHAFYVEPRYTIDDKLVSLTAGLEYAINENRFRSSKNQLEEFEPYFSVGLAGGVSHRFLTSISAGMPQLGATAGISGEYHFTPYSGIRLTADYAEVTNGSNYAGKAMRVGHFNTGFDYMFDLSTLFAGYSSDRRLDVSLAAGPVLSSKTASNNEYVKQLAKSDVGAQVGFPVQYHVTKNFGISLEPRAQAFLNSNYAGINGGRNLIMNVQMGMKYTF